MQNGQISSVALMDARSIAATAANQGVLTPATDFDGEFGIRIEDTVMLKDGKVKRLFNDSKKLMIL